jgi:hypothetical protein
MDIVAAYLNTRLPENQQIPMRLGADEAAVLVALKPAWKKYLNSDGSMYVMITGGLYGLPQAALLWHEHLKATLLSIGYAPSDADPSTFIKLRGGRRSILVIHVDDILHVTDMPGAQQLLLKTLETKYGPPTVQSGDSGIYIGLEYAFDREARSVRITMKKQVDKVLSQFNIIKGSRTPAGVNFLVLDPDSPSVSPTEFASKVMSLYYLVSRVRPDLLFPVSFMATRISECNESDAKKVQRIFQYLFATRDRGIVLKPNGFRLVFAIDASYNILPRARSQSGLHVTLCELPSSYDLDTSLDTSEYGPMIFRSTKQKLVATSSFEAELNAVHEYRDLVLLLRLLLSEFGVNQDEPSVLLQDNGATLLTLRRGRVFHGRSQAIDMRYFKQHEYQVDGIVVFGRSSSDDIAADPLTKPMISTKDQGKLARICNDGGD